MKERKLLDVHDTFNIQNKSLQRGWLESGSVLWLISARRCRSTSKVMLLIWISLLKVCTCRASRHVGDVKSTAGVGGTGFVFQAYKWSRAIVLHYGSAVRAGQPSVHVPRIPT